MYSKINKDKKFVAWKESVFYSFKEDSVINELSKKIEETWIDDIHNWRIISNDEILRKPFKIKLKMKPNE